jgi:NADPH:quinone reductase-like Zn-dependent oxidoreductase
MRAVQVDHPGGPEVLQVRGVPAPAARAGEVLVRTTATSLNPVDVAMRANPRLRFPLTLGWDLAGIVIESDAPDFKPGDRVMALVDPRTTGVGAWSDLVAVGGHTLAPAPASAAITEAATLPLAGLTAWQCWTRPPLPAAPRVLVIGAAGAIGGYLVQLAAGSRRHPSVVDGLVSRTAHVPVARRLGADLVTTDRAALPDHAYDVVFDTARLATSGLDVGRLLRPDGHYVAPSGQLPEVPNAHSVMVSPDAKSLTALAQLVDDGRLRPRVSAHYPLHEVRKAHRRFEAGGLTGKVVLVL